MRRWVWRELDFETTDIRYGCQTYFSIYIIAGDSVLFGFQQWDHPYQARHNPDNAAENSQCIAEIYARRDEYKTCNNKTEQPDYLIFSFVHHSSFTVISETPCIVHKLSVKILSVMGLYIS